MFIAIYIYIYIYIYIDIDIYLYNVCVEGLGHFIFELKSNLKKKKKKKKKITPVKHCTNFPLINSTLWFCSDGFHKWTELDFWIWTNQGMNWPGRPPTFWTLLTFHFDLCLSTGLLALRLLRGVVSSRWFVHFFFFFFYIFFFFFIHLLPWQCFCGLVAQRLNEECVQKPSPERTHSEGTSRRTEHHKRRNTARRRTRTDVVTPFILCLSGNLYVVVLFFSCSVC